MKTRTKPDYSKFMKKPEPLEPVPALEDACSGPALPRPAIMESGSCPGRGLSRMESAPDCDPLIREPGDEASTGSDANGHIAMSLAEGRDSSATRQEGRTAVLGCEGGLAPSPECPADKDPESPDHACPGLRPGEPGAGPDLPGAVAPDPGGLTAGVARVLVLEEGAQETCAFPRTTDDPKEQASCLSVDRPGPRAADQADVGDAVNRDGQADLPEPDLPPSVVESEADQEAFAAPAEVPSVLCPGPDSPRSPESAVAQVEKSVEPLIGAASPLDDTVEVSRARDVTLPSSLTEPTAEQVPQEPAGVPTSLVGQALPAIQGRLESLPYKVCPTGLHQSMASREAGPTALEDIPWAEVLPQDHISFSSSRNERLHRPDRNDDPGELPVRWSVLGPGSEERMSVTYRRDLLPMHITWTAGGPPVPALLFGCAIIIMALWS